jgi:rubrerythrin
MIEYKTVQDVIKLALEKEQEAVTFYTKAVSIVTNPGTRIMLAELAKEEEQHVAYLSDIQAGKTAASAGSRPLPAGMDLSAYLKAEPLSDNSTPQDVMLLAIKREERAVAFYTAQLPVVSGTELQPLFEQLLAWEKEHKERLEAEYDQVVLKDN